MPVEGAGSGSGSAGLPDAGGMGTTPKEVETTLGGFYETQAKMAMVTTKHDAKANMLKAATSGAKTSTGAVGQ